MLTIATLEIIVVLVSFCFLGTRYSNILTFVEFYGQNEMVSDTSGVAPDKYIYAHRYHGVLYSEKVDNKWVFYRDGNTCTLFTSGMLESWEGKNGRG